MVPLSRFNEPQTCDCGTRASRMVTAPLVVSDSMAPKWGMDGKLHDSRASWERSTNAEGEKFYPLQPGEGMAKGVEYKTDQKQLREDIKAAAMDVKYGRVPPVVTLEN